MTRLRLVAIASVLVCLLGGAFALVRAGELEPPGPPGPTMKTLREIPPTWSQLLGSANGGPDGCNSSRFTCVLDDQAVLDNETGLVWNRSINAFNSLFWGAGRAVCAAQNIGSRGGWRLPSLTELRSLLQDLPSDAPFTVLGGPQGRFWTMTSDASDPARAWTVSNEQGAGSVQTRLKTQFHFHLCVRAPGPLAEY